MPISLLCVVCEGCLAQLPSRHGITTFTGYPGQRWPSMVDHELLKCNRLWDRSHGQVAGIHRDRLECCGRLAQSDRIAAKLPWLNAASAFGWPDSGWQALSRHRQTSTRSTPEDIRLPTKLAFAPNRRPEQLWSPRAEFHGRSGLRRSAQSLTPALPQSPLLRRPCWYPHLIP